MLNASRYRARAKKSSSLGLGGLLAGMTALVGAVTGAPIDVSAATGAAAQAIVDPALIAALNNGESPAVLVRYRGKADLSSAFGIADRDARATYVYEALRHTADQAQSQSRTMLASQYHLDANAHDYTVLWISNSIASTRRSKPFSGQMRAR